MGVLVMVSAVKADIHAVDEVDHGQNDLHEWKQTPGHLADNTRFRCQPTVRPLFASISSSSCGHIRVLLYCLVRSEHRIGRVERLAEFNAAEILRRHVPVRDYVRGDGMHVAPAALYGIVVHQPALTTDSTRSSIAPRG